MTPTTPCAPFREAMTPRFCESEVPGSSSMYMPGWNLMFLEPPPPPEEACTSIEKGASEALFVPSVTLISMLEYSCALELEGATPDSSPVEALKLVHDGAFMMLNVRILPLGSVSVGVKE